MQTSTTDRFQVEHIEYVSDRSFDDVVAALEEVTGDVTDGKYGREIGSAKNKQDFESRARRESAILFAPRPSFEIPRQLHPPALGGHEAAGRVSASAGDGA